MKYHVGSIRLPLAATGLALILVMGGLAQGQTASPAPSSGHGLDLANVDTSVKPGDDFYQFAVGGWLKSHPIPPEYPSWGTFNQLVDDNNKRLRGILEQACQHPNGPDGSVHKLGDFYASGLDEAAINQAGATPIQPELARINAIKSPQDLEKEVARL